MEEVNNKMLIEKLIKILKVLAYLYLAVATLSFFVIDGISFSQLIHFVIGFGLVVITNNINYIEYYIVSLYNRITMKE